MDYVNLSVLWAEVEKAYKSALETSKIQPIKLVCLMGCGDPVGFPMDICGRQKVKLEAEIRVGGEKINT